jgi:hypothetical protein
MSQPSFRSARITTAGRALAVLVLDAAARYASCHRSALSRFWGSLQVDADFTALEVASGSVA